MAKYHKGAVFGSEAKLFRDERTGVEIRQITDFPCINHHPFFLIPAADDALRRIFFVSYRSGLPQIYCEDQENGNIIQLTDVPDLGPWSIHPSHDGKHVYFTRNNGGWRLAIETLSEEHIIDFGSDAVKLRESGMVADAMGTTALSWNDRYFAMRYSKDGGNIALFDNETGEWSTILHRSVVAHMHFCHTDPTLLFCAGLLTDRVWSLKVDGSELKRLYVRDKENKQWITHESWLPQTRELAFVDWPKGVKAVNNDTFAVRNVTSINAWHAIGSRDGKLMVCDTKLPDTGIKLFDPRCENGPVETLCHPETSGMGDHWAYPFPYDNGPIKVNAPQHTHAHPSFSPDCRHVIYTSDKSGNSQVYIAKIPDDMLARLYMHKA